MTAPLVVVHGRAQAGQDTFARQLMADIAVNHKLPVRLAAFADAVKETARVLLGMPEEIAHGSQEAMASWTRYGKDARYWLQWVGTELGRKQLHESIWIDRMADRFNDAPPEIALIVSDGQFEREAQQLADALRRPLISVLVVRPGRVPVDPAHASEAWVHRLSHLYEGKVPSGANEMFSLAQGMVDRGAFGYDTSPFDLVVVSRSVEFTERAAAALAAWVAQEATA